MPTIESTEATAWQYSKKQLFWKISQGSFQELWTLYAILNHTRYTYSSIPNPIPILAPRYEKWHNIHFLII